MYTLAIWVATAVVGIDVGWQRLPEGGMQYIIQLDPHTLESLRGGEAIESDIPPSAGEVRSYRIIVGKERLPRETPPAPAPTPKPIEPKAIEPKTVDRPVREPVAPAVFDSPSAPAKLPPKPATEASPGKPAPPWLPLTVTLLGLFASLGANGFLLWIAWGARRQLRRIRREKLPSDAAPRS
jgi:hypothetical protein